MVSFGEMQSGMVKTDISAKFLKHTNFVINTSLFYMKAKLYMFTLVKIKIFVQYANPSQTMDLLLEFALRRL